MLDPLWRHRALAALTEPFDIIVIGAGITGCGITLDAAQRGLRVLLVERGDIASGTSSRSSKLIHGGLRYLKQMQFRITRLACRERDRMLALSPHLVTPVRFIYPAYEGDRTPGWQVDFGLWMYDRLTNRPERHAHLDAGEVQSLAPGLEVDGLDRALAYSDAMADDARLTLAVASTAAAYGAAVLTRCAAERAVRDGRGHVTGIFARDLESGVGRNVEAAVVVNATGVWTDEVRERLGLAGRRLRPSRGIHLMLRRDAVPVTAALTIPSPDDGRPVFLVPHPEGVLLGTTDVYHEGSLDDPRPTADEVGYLRRALAAAFPALPDDGDVVAGTFAGLRPILDTHAEDPSEASREEDIWEEEGLLSVAGGKLTTWRATAEEAVDEAIKLLPEHRARRAAPCATAGTPLAGLAPSDLASRLAASHRLDELVAAAMARRLGSLAWAACELATKRRDLHPLLEGTDLTAAEARAHLRWGGVLHLEDLLLRRVRYGMWDPAKARALVRPLRHVCQKELGWRYRTWEAEVERFDQALEPWTLEGVEESHKTTEPEKTETTDSA
ncbi:MAG: glycerol-3-phosphate dehydrogenase/oxidase [Acidobacteria bacterium]|nr:glycerol-3-phosphate dehydrogenase/oxidase [Acidobacteriota bacterium]